MQIMPMPDPAGAIVALFIYLALLGCYLGSLFAIGAGLTARKRSNLKLAHASRLMAMVAFVYAVAFTLFFSRKAYATPQGLLIMGAILAALAVLAWTASLLGADPVQRRRELAVGVAVACATTAIVMHDIRSRDRRDVFVAAISSGDVGAVKKSLADGCDPNQKNEDGWPVLLQAKNAPTADTLLKAGADLRTVPTMLYQAVERGDLQLATLLLARGADPNVGVGDKSPARVAWWRGKEDMLELLRRSGAKDAETFQRATGALLRAVEAGDVAAVRRAAAGEVLLAEEGQALQRAAERGDAESALLISRRIPAYGAIGEAALTAARHGHARAMAALLDEMDARQPGFVGREMKAFALSIGADSGSLEIVRLALAREADINMPDRQGVLPLVHARRKGHAEIAALLIEHGASEPP